VTAVLAVDVGGTKLAVAVVDSRGRIRMQVRGATPTGGDEATLNRVLLGLIDEVGADWPADRLSAVGIGSAGPVDPAAGTISPVNIQGWRGFDVVAAVTDRLGVRPVVLAGDGHCMALGEWWRGRRASRALLGIVVSTGVGGGFVIDGKVFCGPTGNAGHVGHTVVELDGQGCPCGGRGCVETLASGPALVRWAQAHGWSHETSATTTPDARHLASDASNGDPVARAAFTRAADALATAIVSAAALIDLDDVVVGGGVAAAGDVLFTPLRQAFADRAGLAFVQRARISPSSLGADAGLLGAAALALDAARQNSARPLGRRPLPGRRVGARL
jgi:glucokinase